MFTTDTLNPVNWGTCSPKLPQNSFGERGQVPMFPKNHLENGNRFPSSAKNHLGNGNSSPKFPKKIGEHVTLGKATSNKKQVAFSSEVTMNGKPIGSVASMQFST